ncbi:MAG: GNAT family N-acetyltransferase [Pseudomonadota bacterium]
MTETIVRPLSAEDAGVWRKLWTEYLQFYESAVSEEVYETTFNRLLDPDVQDFHARVAARDSRVIGLVHYIFHGHGWRVEQVTYLQDLYVEKAARGTGAGAALIQAVYDAADAADRPSVYWMTQDFNAPARRLYDQVGQVTPFIKYQRPPR